MAIKVSIGIMHIDIYLQYVKIEFSIHFQPTILRKSNHVECGFIYSVVNRRYASGDSVDLVVIGSGPGGYVAAIKAAQLGLNVNTQPLSII